MPSSKRSTTTSVTLRGLRQEARLLGKLAFSPLTLLLVAAFLVGLAWAYQTEYIYTVNVGTPQDQAYNRNFHARLQEGERSYRWSDVYGYVLFPGLGGSVPLSISLTLDPGRSAPVTLIVNGETLLNRRLKPGWQTISLNIDSSNSRAFISRDTVIEVRAPDFRSEDAPAEPKGVKVSTVTVRQLGTGFVTPPYARLAALAGALLLLYLFVGRSLLVFATTPKARLWAALFSSIAGVVCLLVLSRNHIAVAAAANHALFTFVMMLLLFVLVAIASRAWARIGPLPGQLLAVTVAVAFGVRYGGMALPQSLIIDMDWHMKWLTTLLAGDWKSLYFPGGLSSVPREWGLDVLIPKSPLFYFFSTPLSLLPFRLETLVKWLICLLDSSVVVGVFALGRRLTGRSGAAVAGAALYAVMPLAFRAFAYGILPTIFAQWLAALLFLFLVGFLKYRPGILSLVGFTLLLALTLLAFPTVALFVTVVILATVAAWRLMPGSLPRKSALRPVLASLVAAWLLAIWAYYGIYISPVLTSISALLTPRPGGGSTVRWPGGFSELLGWTAAYVVSVLPLILAGVGVALLWRKRKVNKGTYALLLAWLGIAPLFLLVNLRVDMIGKHLFFTMVPVAVFGGVALCLLYRRGRWGAALVSLALAVVSWQALVFWVERLVRASS